MRPNENETRAREAGCPVVHFEVAPERELGHYWEQTKRLRDEGPILFNTLEQGFWVLTSYDLVRDLYQREELFSASAITPWEPEPEYHMIPMNVDSPGHGKYRRLLAKWFSPGAIQRNVDVQRATCRRYIAEFVSLGACDAVARFAIRFPTEIFAGIMNVPLEDTDLLVSLVEDFFEGYSGDAPEKAGSAYGKIRNYWACRMAEREDEPLDPDTDILSYLLTVESDIEGDGEPRPLTRDEVLDIAFLLVIAGLDTTRAQIGWMLYHFAVHEGDRRRILEDPSLIPNAVEEVLRYYGIVFGDGRKVTRDAVYHGCPMKRGDMVYGLTSAANRDGRYENPDAFVVDREPTPHLAFAAGVHRCLGSHLARSELQVTLEEWLRVIPHYRLGSDDQLVERGAQISLRSLPLVWDV